MKDIFLLFLELNYVEAELQLFLPLVTILFILVVYLILYILFFHVGFLNIYPFNYPVGHKLLFISLKSHKKDKLSPLI